MPVLTINLTRFNRLISGKYTISDLVEKLPWLGLDIEDVGPDYIRVEYTPNRPDLGSPIGIIRAFKGLYEDEVGCPKYKVIDTPLEVYVDKNVEDVRPYLVSAVVTGIRMDEETLVEIIDLQEDLHHGLGRDRRVVSIGIHNYDVIKFPVKYTTVNRDFRFIPLGEYREMSIKEILEEHPTGVKYAHLVSEFTKYPILIDNEGHVLSFPPIINAEYTRVTENTRNLFLDITSTDIERSIQVLNVLVTTLADYGGIIESVKVIYPDKTIITPKLEPKIITYSKGEFKDYINNMLGLRLSINEILESLRRCRMDAEVSNDYIVIKVPPYRVDILHMIDFAEEVAIGLGFWNIKPQLPKTYSVGTPLMRYTRVREIIDIMVGLGFIEVMNFILTNPEEQFDKMNIPRSDVIEVEAPKSMMHRALRKWILPQLLKNLFTSKKETYPQKIFEVGEVFPLTDVEESIHLAAAIAHSRASYSEIKGVLDYLAKVLDLKLTIKPTIHSSFIKGRVASILLNEKEIGVIGEIAPEVLEKFDLEVPVAAMEIDLTEFISEQ